MESNYVKAQGHWTTLTCNKYSGGSKYSDDITESSPIFIVLLVLYFYPNFKKLIDLLVEWVYMN